MTVKHHARLVERGLVLHEEREYERALPLFEQALADWPTCPSAIYNVANTMYMLGREAESSRLLRGLVNASDEQLREGCDDLADSPRSIRLDAYYLLFLTTLEETGSWCQAARYLNKHLRGRARGLRSLFSKAGVVREAEALRRRHSPRSKPVPLWL